MLATLCSLALLCTQKAQVPASVPNLVDRRPASGVEVERDGGPLPEGTLDDRRRQRAFLALALQPPAKSIDGEDPAAGDLSPARNLALRAELRAEILALPAETEEMVAMVMARLVATDAPAARAAFRTRDWKDARIEAEAYFAVMAEGELVVPAELQPLTRRLAYATACWRAGIESRRDRAAAAAETLAECTIAELLERSYPATPADAPMIDAWTRALAARIPWKANALRHSLGWPSAISASQRECPGKPPIEPAPRRDWTPRDGEMLEWFLQSERAKLLDLARRPDLFAFGPEPRALRQQALDLSLRLRPDLAAELEPVVGPELIHAVKSSLAGSPPEAFEKDPERLGAALETLAEVCSEDFVAWIRSDEFRRLGQERFFVFDALRPAPSQEAYGVTRR
ncbi:hypothetical protein Poly30_39630 [Planctomycetes bacterium Poly30]|uniref:Uncharacterized protein n=1 Tax=Saltatorellus ferox TaxID=2528018 RepID=A0A518EWH8_9BACT|nr:hypothetical protein Poly30_39630 [Planctomycetes bacterium Poly30]